MARAAPVAGQGRLPARCGCRYCFPRRAREPGIARGVDLNATGELAALFQRARESGNVAVSGRMELARAGGERRPSSTRHCRSMRRAPRGAVSAASARQRPDPLGFVIGVYDIEELVHVAISLLEPRGVEVLVRDDSAAG
jgi:hypothetical protein